MRTWTSHWSAAPRTEKHLGFTSPGKKTPTGPVWAGISQITFMVPSLSLFPDQGDLLAAATCPVTGLCSHHHSKRTFLKVCFSCQFLSLSLLLSCPLLHGPCSGFLTEIACLLSYAFIFPGNPPACTSLSIKLPLPPAIFEANNNPTHYRP